MHRHAHACLHDCAHLLESHCPSAAISTGTTSTAAGVGAISASCQPGRLSRSRKVSFHDYQAEDLSIEEVIDHVRRVSVVDDDVLDGQAPDDNVYTKAAFEAELAARLAPGVAVPKCRCGVWVCGQGAGRLPAAPSELHDL